jgi:hypothetical protein
MLAYILAILVGSGSVGLYIAAFFFPEIHRKNDFIWSGVGFFYALFLWIYARQITGGILVGQTASVALIGWFVWQTVKLRRQIVPVNQQTPLPGKSQIQQQLGLKSTAPTTGKPQAQVKPQPPSQPKTAGATPQPPATPKPATEPQSTKTAVTPEPPMAESPENTEPGIELEPTPPQSPTSKPLGQAIQPPAPTSPPKPEVTRSIPSQPDAPLPPPITAESVSPDVKPETIPTTAQLDPNHSTTPQSTSAANEPPSYPGEPS